MARLSTALFSAFIVCNARCFAQSPDLYTMLANLTSIDQILTTQLAALTTSQTLFQNNVTSQNQNIIASGSSVSQTYQDELAAVLGTAPPGVDTTPCIPNNNSFVQSVQTTQTNALTCTLNVSNVGNAMYQNPISQNIGIESILTALVAAIINCILSPLVTCVSSIQTQYTNFITDLGLSGALAPTVLNDSLFGTQVLLSRCFNITTFQPANALGAANIAYATTCVQNLQGVNP